MTGNDHPIVEVRHAGAEPVLVVVDRALEVGRECDGVLVDDEVASRRHLRIDPTAGGCEVTDLDSLNGTTRNGRPMRGTEPLLHGDEIAFGATTLRLSPLRAGTARRASETRMIGSSPEGAPHRPGGDRSTVLGTATGGADPGDTTPARRSPPSALADRASPEPGGSTGPAPVQAARTGDDDGLRATAIGAVANLVTTDIQAGHGVDRLAPSSSGTLTFLFSDIESSTEAAQRLGDRAWYQLLRAHNELIDRQVRRAGGTVVKALGDGHLCTFSAARGAIACATAIQRALLDPQFDEVSVRMGLHTGEAIEEAGDVFGLHVNVAARVASRAAGGQIIVSSLTRAIAETSGDLEFGDPVTVGLKGLSGTYDLSELRWSSGA